MRYTKKPVTIEAVRFMGLTEDGDPMFSHTPEWLVEAVAGPEHSTGSIWAAPGQAYIGEGDPQKVLFIGTMEGQIIASKGDWIIRGIKGELYPCKPDIFEATYDVAGGDVAPEIAQAMKAGEQSMLLDMQSECIQLRQALTIARDQFAFYAKEHITKAEGFEHKARHAGDRGDKIVQENRIEDAQASRDKAGVNQTYAEMCQKAIDFRPATGPAEALSAALAETDVEHASDLPAGSVDRLRDAAKQFVIGEGFIDKH